MSTHAVISRHYRYRFAETAKSNVFPLRKVNLKAVNAKGLAASGGKVRVIVVAFVKAVKYTVDIRTQRYGGAKPFKHLHCVSKRILKTMRSSIGNQ